MLCEVCGATFSGKNFLVNLVKLMQEACSNNRNSTLYINAFNY